MKCGRPCDGRAPGRSPCSGNDSRPLYLLDAFLHDANYNVSAALADSTHAVVERYSYAPYGEVTFLNPNFSLASSQTASAIGNQHLYTGRERDPESGLQLNRHRYYASHLGRWLTRDPIGYDGGTNIYKYVDNQTTAYFDPFGLAPHQGDGCFGWVGYTCEAYNPPTEEQRKKWGDRAVCTGVAISLIGTGCIIFGPELGAIAAGGASRPDQIAAAERALERAQAARDWSGSQIGHLGEKACELAENRIGEIDAEIERLERLLELLRGG